MTRRAFGFALLLGMLGTPRGAAAQRASARSHTARSSRRRSDGWACCNSANPIPVLNTAGQDLRELILDLKTANALGLTLPQSFLLRADE